MGFGDVFIVLFVCFISDFTQVQSLLVICLQIAVCNAIKVLFNSTEIVFVFMNVPVI